MKNTVLVILMALVLAFSACGAKTTTTDKEVENDVKVETNTEIEEEVSEEETKEEEPAEEKEEKPEASKQETSAKPQEEAKPSKPQQETPAKPQEEVKPSKPQQEKPAKPQEEVKPSKPQQEKPAKPQEEEKPAKPESDTRPLSDIMASITSNLGEMPMLGEIPLDEENFSFYTFADYIEGAEGLVSEPMMGSFAHSVVLVRLPDGADANAFASKVKNNADPRKWICVEAETVEVKTKGNLVLLVMSSKETANKIVSKF